MFSALILPSVKSIVVNSLSQNVYVKSKVNKTTIFKLPNYFINAIKLYLFIENQQTANTTPQENQECEN